jgi:hypothetical protein
MSTRQQLEDLLDRYAAALASRSPHSLPLSPRVRFTENAQELALDEGLWATATACSPHQIRFIDPASGQAGFMCVVTEHTEPTCVTVRLKVEQGAISEIEQFVVRRRPTLFNPDGFVRESLFRAIDPARRAQRSVLAQVPNRYFDGIERDDGGIIPVREDCLRLENGVQTVLAGESDFASSTASQGFNLFGMGVAEQISTGFFAFLPRIRDRRVQVIDEEQGMALAICVFDHPGRMTEVNVRGFGPLKLPPLFCAPFSGLVAELFQVEDGLIRAICATIDIEPYGFRTGW